MLVLLGKHQIPHMYIRTEVLKKIFSSSPFYTLSIPANQCMLRIGHFYLLQTVPYTITSLTFAKDSYTLEWTPWVTQAKTNPDETLLTLGFWKSEISNPEMITHSIFLRRPMDGETDRDTVHGITKLNDNGYFIHFHCYCSIAALAGISEEG